MTFVERSIWLSAECARYAQALGSKQWREDKQAVEGRTMVALWKRWLEWRPNAIICKLAGVSRRVLNASPNCIWVLAGLSAASLSSASPRFSLILFLTDTDRHLNGSLWFDTAAQARS